MPITLSAEARRQIGIAAVEQVKSKILANRARLVKAMREKINTALEVRTYQSRTVQSLLATGGGRDNLRRDLGLVDPESKVLTILQLLQQSIRPNARTSGDELVFEVGIAPNIENTLLANPAALQEATRIDGTPGKVAFIPWLSWLLKDGGNVLVSTHFVKRSNPRKRGRSGQIGFMFPTNVRNDTPFTITPQYHRGVDGDNFITRILDEVGEVLSLGLPNVLLPAIQRVIRQ